MSETLKCPRDRTELIKVMGNLLTCPECDIIFVEKHNVNDFVGKVEVLPDEDFGEFVYE